MKRGNFIGMDVHCQFCEIAVLNASGKVVQRTRCATTISTLAEVIEQVPRPRSLVIEEGPLAGWLCRNLEELVDDMVVSEPRRNRLISRDGDKDDDLDDPCGPKPQGCDAPSAHRRPGYSLSGCTPAEPDSASPGAGSLASCFDCDKVSGWQAASPWTGTETPAHSRGSLRQDASLPYWHGCP
jgi:hypothetical protein